MFLQAAEFNFTEVDGVRTTVCNLHPYTLYTFSVQVKPEQLGLWSDPVNIQNTTESTGRWLHESTWYAFGLLHICQLTGPVVN